MAQLTDPTFDTYFRVLLTLWSFAPSVFSLISRHPPTLTPPDLPLHDQLPPFHRGILWVFVLLELEVPSPLSVTGPVQHCHPFLALTP